MSELIVAFVIRSHHGKPYGYRIYEDGQAEQYRDSKLVKAANGSMQDQPVTPGFYPATTLNKAQTDSVRQGVDASGLRDLPGQVHHAGTGSTSGGKAEWDVMTSSGVKSIHLDWPPAGDPGSGLLALSTKIGGVVGEALAGSA